MKRLRPTPTRPTTSRRPRRRSRVVLALLAGSLLLTGCDFDVYDLPLPGGADVGDNPMTITVEFRDVLDLVPKSSVKVNEVDVGQVTDITLDGDVAKVTLKLRDDTELPENADATIRQTSLLGEKFVSLAAPKDGATGELADGDTIPIARTGDNPEVEEVLGALSLILRGGGIGQLNSIVKEVNLALDGREDSTRSVLSQLDTFVGGLDDNKDAIVEAIEKLNRLAVSLRQQQPSINAALDELPSALVSIDSQREGLVTMLQSLDQLSTVGVRVIKKTKADTIESLNQLQPVLTQLANSGDAFVNSFNVILTYPFVDEVVGRDPQVARNLHVGDYTNLSVQLDVDLTDLPDLPGLPCTILDEIPIGEPLPPLSELCQGAQDAIAECINERTVAACAELPGNVIDLVCDSLPVPIPLVCTGTKNGNGTGNGNGGLNLPGIPGLPDLGTGLDLGGLLGNGKGKDGVLSGLLGRPALGSGASSTPDSARTMSLRQMSTTFDPGLTALLTPGMVLR